MVLKNTTSNSIAVVPKFTPLSGSSPFSLPQVSLPANATTEVDLTPLLSAARSRHDLDVVSVEVTNWAAPGSVVGSLYGINNDTGMNYDIPLRDSGLVRTMTGSYPWKISNDFNTVVYITNISDQEAQFVGEVNSHGAKVALDPRKLRPGETAVFDMRKFRDEQTADASGNKLSLDVTQGQFKWSVFGVTNGKLLLIGRAEIVSRTQRISTSYSCNDPCPPYIWGWLDPFSPPIIILNETTTQSSAWQVAYYDSGYQMGPYTGYASYSVEGANIWIDPSSGHTTTAAGDAPGDGCVFADMGSQERYSWDGQNCYDNGFADPINDTECTFVAVPTRLSRDSYSDLKDLGGCGAKRDISYTLLDQNGDPIEEDVTLKEVISNFSGPEGLKPPTETSIVMNAGAANDVVGYNVALPCPPPFTASMTQSFKVIKGSTTYNLTTTNAISMGRNSDGTKFVNVTMSQ